MQVASAPIAPIRFENARLDQVGIEIRSLAEIRQFAAATLVRPQRVEFHLLLLMREGEGEHTIDFQRYALRPGTLVYVRPGQVQQWHMHSGLQGEFILMKPEALSPVIGRSESDLRLLATHRWTASLVADASLADRLECDMTRLRADIAIFDGGETQVAVIWHTLLAALLRVADAMQANRPASRDGAAALFALFEQLLSEEGHRRRTVAAYAERLGYSESSLNRACLAMAEKTAKRLLDERIALEAKRLLVHTPVSVTEVAYRLGFTEPTNFVKFFARMTQMTPRGFRGRHDSAS